MRRTLVLGLTLLLAACAAPAVPVLAPPISYPSSTRERIIAIAVAEWREWGEVTRRDGQAAPPGAEAAPDNLPRMIAYWRSVPQDEGAIARNRGRYAANPWAPGLWAEPAWSAAFISYVMVRAGVDVPEFRPDAAHVVYLDQMTALAAAWPGRAPFVPLSPAVATPAPGDLVCADRSRRPLADWADRAREAPSFRPMHCDLVVATGPGVVEAIGGNLGDTVVRMRYAADDQGRLRPRSPPWVLVVRNRLGVSAPSGSGPQAALPSG